MLVDITCVTTRVGNKIVSYYLTKETAVELFSDANNIYNPRKKGSNELRVSLKTFVENGNMFEIVIPKVNPKEYEEYLSVTEDKGRISKIFGPFSNKIRPDVLNWIISNKEEFKNAVNNIL
jgi:hypothetical protein